MVLHESEERTRLSTTLSTTLSSDARFVLQQDGKGDARVLERRDAGLALMLRLSLPGEATLAPDHRLFVRDRDARSLVVVDLATRETRRFVDVDAFATVGNDLVLASPTSVRRFAWPSLAPHGSATTTQPIGVSEHEFRAVGQALIVGDALVSFETGAVLARKISFGPSSLDGTRVVGCTEDHAVAVFDTTAGTLLARFETAGSAVCAWSWPGLSPDGRHAVAVDAGDDKKGNRPMMAIVYDVESKKIERTPDPKLSFGTASSATSIVDDKGLVCVEYGSAHWHRLDCPWALANGKASKAQAPAVAKSVAKSPKLPGTELARATNVAGALVVATADAAKGDLPFAHLRVHVLDAKGDRAMELVPNAFYVASFEHDGERRPELRFLDATHVLFESHSPPVPNFVLDTVSATFEALDPEVVFLHGRFALLHDALVDLVSHETRPLTPTAAAFHGAPEIGPACQISPRSKAD